MKIEFKRIERDSPANRRRREEGDNRGIVYDFDVWIDGERRAILHRLIYGHGYDLMDRDHRPIQSLIGTPGPGRRTVTAANQATFREVVENCLKRNLIPTIAEQDRMTLIEQAERDNKKFDDAAEDARLHVERAAPQLLAACEEALAFLDAPANSPRQWPVSRANLRAMLCAAILAATVPAVEPETEDA